MAACRYPPAGRRSYGPVRSALTIGPALRAADEQVACIIMIEWARPEFGRALVDIRAAAQAAGIGCGMHCNDGDAGARWLADGFTFVSISSDLSHLQAIGRDHLARAGPSQPGAGAMSSSMIPASPARS